MFSKNAWILNFLTVRFRNHKSTLNKTIWIWLVDNYIVWLRVFLSPGQQDGTHMMMPQTFLPLTFFGSQTVPNFSYRVPPYKGLNPNFLQLLFIILYNAFVPGAACGPSTGMSRPFAPNRPLWPGKEKCAHQTLFAAQTFASLCSLWSWNSLITHWAGNSILKLFGDIYFMCKIYSSLGVCLYLSAFPMFLFLSLMDIITNEAT